MAEETDQKTVDEANPTEAAEWAPLSDPDFKEQLAAVIPHLRAFGRSLSGSRANESALVSRSENP